VHPLLIIVLALLLACRPAMAAAKPGKGGRTVPEFVLPVPAFSEGMQSPPAFILLSVQGSDGAAYDVSMIAIDTTGRVSDPVEMRLVPAPVPEPMSVLTLACGLLLMMPGAWLARWSCLGDRVSLLQRRFP
jgi:hypothetical protein